jgi:NADPH-dependent ferric siderophore reductase
VDGGTDRQASCASLPAIAALCEALDRNQFSVALIEVTNEIDQLPVNATQVHWLHRRTRPSGTPRLLSETLRTLAAPRETGQAYLLGESRTMLCLRDQLAPHGIDPEHTFLKGYWNR